MADTGIYFENGNKKVYISKLSNNNTYDADEALYIQNHLGAIIFNTHNKDINIETLYDKVNELGFKGPYIIEAVITYTSAGRDSTVRAQIGKIYQLGTIVYGYLWCFTTSQQFSAVEIGLLTFYDKDGNTVQVQGPEISGTSFYWTSSSHQSNGTGDIALVQIEKVSQSVNSLAFTVGEFYQSGLKITAGHNISRSYFCYSTSSSHHPS